METGLEVIDKSNGPPKLANEAKSAVVTPKGLLDLQYIKSFGADS